MKKITLVVALFIGIATFAQKDELKTLKRIYAKDVATTTEIDEYKAALKSLETLKEVAHGEAIKVFIPFDATTALSSIGSIKEILDNKNK